MSNTRMTAAEMRALANQAKSPEVVDLILEQAKKVASTGGSEFALVMVNEYHRMNDAQKKAVHAMLEALGYTLEMNYNAALYHMLMKW